MYLLNFNFKFFGVEFDLLQTCTERRHFDLIADLDLELWAFFPFKTSRIRWFPTSTLRKWNPRPACGTAFTSVRISMSVFGFVPTRDEPAECLPWTRRTRVRPCSPGFGNADVHSGQ